MTTLLALRIFGPIDLASFAARLDLTEVRLELKLWELEDKGLAAYPPDVAGTWSVTALGRLVADSHEVVDITAVRRDEQRACVGVSHE